MTAAAQQHGTVGCGAQQLGACCRNSIGKTFARSRRMLPNTSTADVNLFQRRLGPQPPKLPKRFLWVPKGPVRPASRSALRQTLRRTSWPQRLKILGRCAPRHHWLCSTYYISSEIDISPDLESNTFTSTSSPPVLPEQPARLTGDVLGPSHAC